MECLPTSGVNSVSPAGIHPSEYPFADFQDSKKFLAPQREFHHHASRANGTRTLSMIDKKESREDTDAR
ncbi:MAG: hypothetical protein AAF802_13210 [Planctomycetota bacterium]